MPSAADLFSRSVKARLAMGVTLSHVRFPSIVEAWAALWREGAIERVEETTNGVVLEGLLLGLGEDIKPESEQLAHVLEMHPLIRAIDGAHIINRG